MLTFLTKLTDHTAKILFTGKPKVDTLANKARHKKGLPIQAVRSYIILVCKLQFLFGVFLLPLKLNPLLHLWHSKLTGSLIQCSVTQSVRCSKIETIKFLTTINQLSLNSEEFKSVIQNLSSRITVKCITRLGKTWKENRIYIRIRPSSDFFMGMP